MAIKGNLNTMTLHDLFHWVVDHSATGVLEIERQKVRKRIAFVDGRISGCRSDDPPSRIGQFLLARGKISKEALATALEFQKKSGQTLGAILQDMGEIESEEFTYELSAKAEETLLSVFDWKQAVFEFHAGEQDDPWMIDVSMSVEELLSRGTSRQKQLDAIRRLFASSGVVLARTTTPIPPEIFGQSLVRSILELVDGDRALGELVIHARASEFLVLKFLASAVHSDFLRIEEVRSVEGSTTLLDVERTPIVEELSRPEPKPQPVPSDAPKPHFEEQIELAQHFLAQGEVEAALQILDDCYEQRPGSEFLRHLMAKAETDFIDRCRNETLPGHTIPERRRGAGTASSPQYNAAERFLIGMVDEGHSIQTLLWIAPMREIDVYRSLTRMIDAGILQLRESSAESADAPATIHWA